MYAFFIASFIAQINFNLFDFRNGLKTKQKVILWVK